MQSKLKKEIGKEQAGFRSGMDTRVQILNLKMVLEKRKKRTENMVKIYIYAL